MQAYIGRQPLYNKQYVLYGYDLLHRDNVTKNFRQYADKDRDLLRVYADATSVFDFQKLTEGKTAHMSFTKELLMSNLPYTADPKRIVIEISSEISVDGALTDKLIELKGAGYKLALSGYTKYNGPIKFNKIVNLFDYVYLNVAQSNRLALQEIITELRKNSTAKLIAEQVDTEADFDKTQRMNFTLFQGILFGMPSVLREDVNISVTPFGELYNELAKPAANFETCVKMLISSPVLTHMFLQASPTPKEKRDVEADIRKNMMTVGMGRLRRWSTMMLLRMTNVTDTAELPIKALRRGLFIERLIEESKTKADEELGFFLGVFSLLDAVSDTPLDSLLGQLRIETELRNALLGKASNAYSAFLDFAKAFEESPSVTPADSLRLDTAGKKLEMILEKCGQDAENAFSCLNPYLAKTYR